jgi:predicted nucleic acid-binding protein
MDLIADTTFLVGLWRKQRWAIDFAHAHASSVIGLPWVVLGEFWHGAVRAGHETSTVESFLRIGIPLLNPEPVIPVYARMCARLQQDALESYRATGQNDLWIAAAALGNDKPLVTRNRRHFDAVSGLRIVVPQGA